MKRGRPLSKNVFYFPHYTKSTSELNLIEHRHKSEGYKAYYRLQEMVADADYHRLSLATRDEKDMFELGMNCKKVVVDDVIRKYQHEDYDYVTNTLNRSYPIGTDVEIFSFEILEKTWQKAILPSEREHVTLFIKNKKLGFKLGDLKNSKNLGNLRWTLDREEDLNLIRKIIAKVNKNPILMSDILNLFSIEPELIKINEHIPQNEGMLKSLKKDNEFKKLKTD